MCSVAGRGIFFAPLPGFGTRSMGVGGPEPEQWHRLPGSAAAPSCLGSSVVYVYIIMCHAAYNETKGPACCRCSN